MPDWREEIAQQLSELDWTRSGSCELSQHLEDRYQELVSGSTEQTTMPPPNVLMELKYENGLAQGQLGMVREAPQGPAAPGDSGTTSSRASGRDLRYALRQFQRNPGLPRWWRSSLSRSALAREHSDFQRHRQRAP